MGDLTTGYSWNNGATFTPSKMNDSVNNATINAGALSADSTGRAKMADGFLSADSTGRAKMADGFVDYTKVAAGAVVQVVAASTSAVVTSANTLQIPLDDTIPQNTEGTQIFSQAITPQGASHKILIRVVLNVAATGSETVVAALFRDSGANALAAKMCPANLGGSMTLEYVDSPATTSAVTYKVRFGSGNGTYSVSVNGQNSSYSTRIFGGVSNSHLTLTEIKA